MKILHIAHFDTNAFLETNFFTNTTNGLERFLRSFISYDDNEHFFLFFDVHKFQIQVQSINEHGEVTFYTFLDCPEFSFAAYEHVFTTLRTQLGVDLVHIHFQQEFVKIIPSVLKQLQIPSIATIHDENYLASEFGLSQNYKYDEKVATFFADLAIIIFPHKVIASRYQTLYPEIESKMQIIPDGVTIDYIAKVNQSKQKFHVVFLGGLNQYKGSHIVCDVMRNNHNPNIKFTIVGNLYDVKETYETIPYTTTTLTTVMKKLNPDLVVIPSIVQESYSYTAAEATAMGFPVLTFAVGALTEIEHEGRGFVEKKLNADALLAHIEKIFKQKSADVTWWNSITAQVKAVTLFKEEQTVTAYQNIYQKYAIDSQIKNINYAYFLQQNYQAWKRENIEFKKVNELAIRLVNEPTADKEKIKALEEVIAYKESHPIRNFGSFLKKKLRGGQ